MHEEAQRQSFQENINSTRHKNIMRRLDTVFGVTLVFFLSVQVYNWYAHSANGRGIVAISFAIFVNILISHLRAPLQTQLRGEIFRFTVVNQILAATSMAFVEGVLSPFRKVSG